jgi:hypothetical protein
MPFTFPTKSERVTWNRQQFERMTASQVIVQKETGKPIEGSDRRWLSYIELIEGEIVENRMTSGGRTLSMEDREQICQPFLDACGSGCHIYLKHPLGLGDRSVLLPRMAITNGDAPAQIVELSWPRNSQAMPATTNISLVLEYSTDTLKFGRATKAEIYALAGIPEYWVYRLEDEMLEVHRNPMRMGDRHLHSGYGSVEHFDQKQSVVPLFASESFKVDELFEYQRTLLSLIRLW